MLFSHYDIDNFDEDGCMRRCRSYSGRKYDPLRYSRRAAICERCGAQYANLHRSISETVKRARADGWQIELVGARYEWYCPDCKAAHDFESALKSKEEEL